MKSKLTAIVGIVCLSASVPSALIGIQAVARDVPDRDAVASEYNPPGRGGAYPGGTRFMEPPNHADYV